jgi:hypothetical protein
MVDANRFQPNTICIVLPSISEPGCNVGCEVTLKFEDPATHRIAIVKKTARSCPFPISQIGREQRQEHAIRTCQRFT